MEEKIILRATISYDIREVRKYLTIFAGALSEEQVSEILEKKEMKLNTDVLEGEELSQLKTGMLMLAFGMMAKEQEGKE